MKTKIDNIKSALESELSASKSSQEIEALRIKYLGRKGPVQALMANLRDVSSEERPQAGAMINELKKLCEERLSNAAEKIAAAEMEKSIGKESIDITLPGRRKHLGRKHIINQVRDEMLDILINMGFSVQYGPDIDSDYYNFEGLNYPPDHPAREMQDTFYISPEHLLRSHTSNVQLRTMEHHQPPIRIITPGTVYRNETVSARSHVFFHQIEGMYIDEGVTFAELLSTMREFWSKFFGKEVKARFRPSFFPFVEPGLEVDIACTACQSKGCRLCKGTGWLEVAGAGMVHREVLKNGGIDPEKYSGYAWGLGIERLALLRYGIPDIRDFFENDARFHAQF